MDITLYEFNFFTINVRLTIFHSFLFILNFLLFAFSGKIVRVLSFDDDKISINTWTFRFFNILFFFLHSLDLLLVGMNKTYQQQLSKIALTLISFYTIKMFLHVVSHFIRQKFGHQKIIDSKNVNIENYSTRVVNILTTSVVLFINLIIVINIWGFNSLLETTGLIGLILGFFALTSSIWGPDLFHGLVLLNSNMVEDGDILEFDGEHYIVYKTSFLETVLLNVASNHRTRIRNSNLSNIKIDNLTKLAHSQGLRETIIYKIGYPNLNLQDYHRHEEQVYMMMEDAFRECTESENININENKPFEIFLTETADYSLNYSVSFYLSKVKKTKFTYQARELLRTKFQVNRIILKNAIKYGISLSTPIIHKQL